MLFAVFKPDGTPLWQSLDPSFALAMAATEAMEGEHWTDLKKLGFEVKPVEIVAVPWKKKEN